MYVEEICLPSLLIENDAIWCRNTHLEPMAIPPRKRGVCREQLFGRTWCVRARCGQVTQLSPRLVHRDGLGFDLDCQIVTSGDFGQVCGVRPVMRLHRRGDDADTGASQGHGEAGKRGSGE